MDNAVELKEVCKFYKKECVLHSVSVCLPAGKIHGFIGPNGSGKTVLLKLLCGLTKPTSGSIVIFGKDVTKNYDASIKVGAIIEAPGFLPYDNGFRNLQYLARLTGNRSKEQIFEAMKVVGLDPNEKKHVGHYSLGMRQRLGIAQAIMEKPNLLTLDEPFNGLDKEGIGEMHILMNRLRAEGVTIIIASHYQQDIDELCDTVHELNQGKLV